MSAVEDSLKSRIRLEGPLPLDRFMSEALLNPEDGYYTRGAAFGAAGDFTTAPEISQVFGELIGLWAADTWQSLGMPQPLKIIELGPGRGTLMADMLRAARALPGFLDTAELHFVEASPALRQRQAETLRQSPLTPQWHNALSEISDGPAIIIANEFFDALPIRQYEFNGRDWQERRVGLAEDGGFIFVSAPGGPPPQFRPETPPKAGDILEVSSQSVTVMSEIAARLARFGGAALIIDYGYSIPAYGDSFQAVHRHQYTDPLAAPGTADLTAHVNFGLLSAVAREAGAAAHGPVPQGQFLTTLGIAARTSQLLRQASGTQRETLEADTRRLTAENEMGLLFKALAVTPQNARAPAGFEPAGNGGRT